MKEVYCDGGCYQQLNKIMWAYIIVDNNKIIQENHGNQNCSGFHREDVEKGESEAFYNACQFISNHPNNYVIYSDSRSFIDKIQKRCSNATKNPHVKYIQNLIAQIKGSPLPQSLVIKWKPRRSNKWSKYVDDLANKKMII
jgi:ribonuclease HI